MSNSNPAKETILIAVIGGAVCLLVVLIVVWQYVAYRRRRQQSEASLQLSAPPIPQGRGVAQAYGGG